MTKYILLFFISFYSFANISQKANRIIGHYKITTSNYDVLVKDHTELYITIEDDELVLRDEQAKYDDVFIDEKLKFEEQVSECHDSECAGIYFIKGQVNFVKGENSYVPELVVTYDFYRDLGSRFEQWSKTYSYKFLGATDDIKPDFISTSLDKGLERSIRICSRIVKGKNVNCASIDKYEFPKGVNENSVRSLNDYLSDDRIFKRTISVTELRKILRMNAESQTLRVKLFGNNLTDKKVAQIKRSLIILGNNIASLDATKIYIRPYQSIDSGRVGYEFLMIDKHGSQAYRVKIVESY